MEFTKEWIDSLTVDANAIVRRISELLDIPVHQVQATVSLLKEGNTIPFISRYRKEVTGSLNEVQVRDISHQLSYLENLEERKLEVVRNIFSQGKLTEDLFVNIHKCQTLTELEDLYAPYKKKKKTRAMIAMEKGLVPLADYMEQNADVEKEAEKYLNPELGVNTVEEALQGAMDIIAERVSQDMDRRAVVREYVQKTGKFEVKGLKEADVSVYKMYYDYTRSLSDLKPHHVLAINRGEREGELEASIVFDVDTGLEKLYATYTIANTYHRAAIEDGYKRLLVPSVLREIRTQLTQQSENHGIAVFSENLKHLLMQPPIKRTRLLAIDTGIRTGSKCVALDENGKYLGHFVIYQHQAERAEAQLVDAIRQYNVQLIAIGNGTGSHEVQFLVSEMISEYNLPIQFTVVDEDGASVYSASDIAIEEFPDLDLTVRGAISIGRRLQDPLAELVKIEPKALGVGLYQHDVDQKELANKLDETVESVVNQVGVNINTASAALLRYVSGVSSILARNIIEYRNAKGAFKSREELKRVPGFGPKTFEQAAGFLKVPESDEYLDNTWVHPENYPLAREILAYMKSGKELSRDVLAELKKKYNVGDTTIQDIIQELRKPNRDPREDYPQPILQKGVVQFEDLKVGMKVKGKIKNVVDFGAFVDIGIKETALVHLSQLSDQFVHHPSEIVKVGDVREFTIVEIDPLRKRIGLSLKSDPFGTQKVRQREEKPREGRVLEERKGSSSREKKPAPLHPTLGDFFKNVKFDK
ncbi:Tex family protein [Thermospira aquatica]|uniref:RNA-binding transcriptional accessory protein n=1 Tax=Thermospira aquatica TaxID=2828656 RepID=A0AAX3BFR8_9SPIR|nr:Tex family protein [Thermospira aquatica]URA11150.1 RNA-binding transcriptional accessory protein [Thermospira aquatica]